MYMEEDLVVRAGSERVFASKSLGCAVFGVGMGGCFMASRAPRVWGFDGVVIRGRAGVRSARSAWFREGRGDRR